MDGVVSDDDQESVVDDTFSALCGDLGLGEGLRAPSYLQFQLDFTVGREDQDEPLSQTSGKAASGDRPQITEKGGFTEETRSSNTKYRANFVSHLQEKRRSSDSVLSTNTWEGCFEEVEEVEKFPSYADVPYGTSLRQQKKLFAQKLGSIMKKHGSENEQTFSDGEERRLTNDEIDQKLHAAIQEVEELKLDLEICRQRLDAKYQAIAVLQKQSDENSHELLSSELKAREKSKQLAEEVNKLQFELQMLEASFEDSQQTWCQRFDRPSDANVDTVGHADTKWCLDSRLGGGSSLVVEQSTLGVGETPRETLQRKYLRVCKENALLTSTLKTQMEELRQANAFKSALSREREELLAMLDLKDRTKFRQCHPQVSEEHFFQYSTTELAVLGTCRCKGLKSELCACAYAAANLMREVTRLKEEARLMLQRRDEAYMTVDAYRLAFEEQLQKSRCLSQQLASLATSTSRATKAQAAIKWLLSVLADDDYPPITRDGGDNSPNHTPSTLQALTLPELVSLLTDMLHEKKEALAHQKLAAQVLAGRLQEMERKFQQSSESDGDVNHD